MTTKRFGGVWSRVSLAVSTAALMAFAAPDARAVTLVEAVEAALANNPDIGIVQSDRRAVEQELRQARGLFLPSVDLRAAAGPEYTDSPTTRAQDGDSETEFRVESRLTVTQLLFDGFASHSEVDRQLARLDSAARRVLEASEFVALDAIQAYLDVLRNQAIVELAQENERQLSRIQGQVRQLADQGRGGIADVRQAEARVASAQESIAISEGNVRDALARFERVVGVDIGVPVEPTVPASVIPASGQQAASVARLENPTVKIRASDLKVAQAELVGSRAGFFPSLNLELGAGANNDLDGVDGRNLDASALVVMNYNLFRGGIDTAREQEAYERLREQRFLLEQAQRDAAETASLAYSALETARAQAAALSAQSEANLRTRNAYAEEFQLGQRSLLDLLDAENEFFVARTNLVTAQLNEAFAVYRVLAVIGELLPNLELTGPAESVNIFREQGSPDVEDLLDQTDFEPYVEGQGLEPVARFDEEREAGELEPAAAAPETVPAPEPVPTPEAGPAVDDPAAAAEPEQGGFFGRLRNRIFGDDAPADEQAALDAETGAQEPLADDDNWVEPGAQEPAVTSVEPLDTPGATAEPEVSATTAPTAVSLASAGAAEGDAWQRFIETASEVRNADAPAIEPAAPAETDAYSVFQATYRNLFNNDAAR